VLRIVESEILDGPNIPDEAAGRAYRDMAAIHRWLGDVRFLTRTIRRDPHQVRRILDVGCGTGLVLERISRELGVEAVGGDIRPRRAVEAAVPIVQVDARFDPLPPADVAYCMNLGHHLDAEDLIRVIRNVGRYCRRFIVVDLVRHRLPLALFGMFVSPALCAIAREDGRRSIRRSYTPAELRAIAAAALAGTPAKFQLSVAPFYVRQVVDITYRGAQPDAPLPAFAEEGAWAR
jgi:SAM-dependent methyltransferase